MTYNKESLRRYLSADFHDTDARDIDNNEAIQSRTGRKVGEKDAEFPRQILPLAMMLRVLYNVPYGQSIQTLEGIKKEKNIATILTIYRPSHAQNIFKPNMLYMPCAAKTNDAVHPRADPHFPPFFFF